MLSGDADVGRVPGVSPLYDVKRQAAQALAGGRSSTAEPAGNLISSHMEEWWSQTGSNRRPEACKATALPAELWPLFGVDAQMLPVGAPREWWAWEDLNFRPHAYQARALTN
jgi:hypothetical protein